MIYCVGSINLDHIGRVARLPSMGETMLGGTYSTAPGGKGANQSLAARRAGANVIHIGCVGDDLQSVEALALLKQDGVDLSHVRTKPVSTGVAMILVDDAGENSICVFSGANGLVTPSDVEIGLEGLAAGDVVLVQQEIPSEAVHRALLLARRAGARSILNTAPVTADTVDLAPLATVVVSNETEFERISGASSDSIEPALKEWTSHHAQPVIVTLGANGAWLAENGAIVAVPAIPIQPVDSVGAGDTYCGYLAAALEKGDSLRNAAAVASVAAGLTCLKRGAQPSIPYADEVARYDADYLRRGASSVGLAR